MASFMHGSSASTGKTCITIFALERLGTSVNIVMFTQFGIVTEPFATNFTFELSVIDGCVLGRDMFRHFPFANHDSTNLTGDFVVEPLYVSFQSIFVLGQVSAMGTR